MSEPPNDSFMLTLNSTNSDFVVSADISTSNGSNKQIDNDDEQILKDDSSDIQSDGLTYFELENLNILNDNVAENAKQSLFEQQQVEDQTSTSNDAIVEEYSPLNSTTNNTSTTTNENNTKLCETTIESQMSPTNTKIEIKQQSQEKDQQEVEEKQRDGNELIFDESIQEDTITTDNKYVDASTNETVSSSISSFQLDTHLSINTKDGQSQQHSNELSNNESLNKNTKKRKLNDESLAEDEELNGKIKNKLYINQLSINVPNEIFNPNETKMNDSKTTTTTTTPTGDSYSTVTSCGEKTNEWLQPSSTTPSHLIANSSDEFTQFPMSSSSFVEFFTMVVSNRPAINGFIIESISENVFNFIRFTQVF